MGTVTSQIRIDYVFEFYDSEPLMDCTCTLDCRYFHENSFIIKKLMRYQLVNDYKSYSAAVDQIFF